jgi:hypothetical protein
MSNPRLTGYLAVGLVMAAGCATYGRAERSARCVSGSLLELRDANGQRLPRLEASGIAYYQGRLVVVDDILSSLFIFDRMGKLSETVALTGFPPEGSKFEDLAIDPATHSFFAVGSHSGWDREVLEATSVLLRFRLGEGSEGLELHQDRIEAFPLYKSFEKLGLWRPMGMKIEGLAVDPKSAELYVGLREPIDRARIYGISLLGLEQAARGGTPPDLGLEVSFDAGRVEETPFSISALLWIPHRRGLLIATSTEDDTTHSFLGNRLWFYSREGQVELIQDTFDRGLKAEGLAMDEGCLYISYDNDQDDTEIPSQIRTLPLASLFDGQ